MTNPSTLKQDLQTEHLLPPTGLLLVHKPEGPTSHEIVDLARKALGLRKIGHCGTLDPFASGLLILLIGEATRVQNYFLTMNKTYEATFTFGKTTDTLDPTGAVTETDSDFTLPALSDIEALIKKKFLGTLEQLPPRYSAVKVNGKRAYSLSRAQKPFELKPKEVTLHHFDIEKHSDQALTVSISCSSGTYVRALVRDLATELGTCGMLTHLSRTRVEDFSLTHALPLTELHPDNDKLASQIQSLHKHITDSHTIELDKNGLTMLKMGKLHSRLKRKKPLHLETLSDSERNLLTANYQLLFYNNILVGIWDHKRNTLIYNLSKYF